MHMQNLTGQVLGQYELREILGFGGMGVAYRAYQKSLEREVAVKVLSPGLASESGYIERFHREAKTASALEHAHIVPVYDYGVQGDISYVVMRLLPGGSLEDRMAQRARNESELPSLSEVAKLLEQLASALDYAHGRGVVHRDIKPANIMFDEQGIAYVVDFGIAKLLESTTAFTASGTPVGTPMYMPPEQWRSETLTPAADQYALAVTIYHLMTGKLPFEATTPYGMLHKHLNEDPTPPETYRPDIPDGVRRVIQQAMQKRPEERYTTVGAFAGAFREAIGTQTGVAQTGFFTMPVLVTKAPTSGAGGTINVQISPTGANAVTETITIPAHKSPLFWIVAAAAVIAIAALIVLLATRSGDEEPPETISAAMLRETVAAELNSTTSAELAPTIEALSATETAIARREHNATATKNAADIRATTRAEPTQTAAVLTATADSWTATPPPTATPTVTATDMPTATSSPAPAGPPAGFNPPTPQPQPAGPVVRLRAVWNDDEFILINASTENVDLRGVIFEQQNQEGETVRVFYAREWQEQSALTGTLQPSRCVQFITGSATHITPQSAMCPGGLSGWFSSNATSKYFWRDDAGAETFTVRMEFQPEGEPFATCTIADGECELQLPTPPTGNPGPQQ